MRRAWMPLYVADFIADTMDLSTLETGAYIRLIGHYWLHGGLPGDERKLAKIAGARLEIWRKLSPFLAKKFYMCFPDAWFHKRIEAELQHADNVSKSAKARSLLGVAARKPTGQPEGQKTKQPTGQPEVNHARANHYHKERVDSTSLNHSTPNLNRPTKLKHLIDQGSIDSAKAKLKEEFEQFWNEYGHKVARPVAFKAFAKARAKVSLDEILKGVQRYQAEVRDKQFFAHPATWLNAERWTDIPAEAKPVQNGHVEPPKWAPGQNRFRSASGLWVDDKFFPD